MEHLSHLAATHRLILRERKLCLRSMTGADGVMTVLLQDLLIGVYDLP